MRKLLLVIIFAGCASNPQAPAPERQSTAANLDSAFESITAEELIAHIRVLASDEYEGRAPGTRGEQLTVDYLTEQFRSAGLQAGNPDGTFVQKVPVIGYTSQPSLSVTIGTKTRQLRYPDEYVAHSRWMVPAVSVEKSDIVFVGHGIEAPEFGWSDYKGIDVQGKTLLMIEGEPRKPSPPGSAEPSQPRFRAMATYYGTRRYKYEIAASKGAAAVFFVHDPNNSRTTFEKLQARFGNESFELMPDHPSERIRVDGWLAASAFEAIVADAGQDAATMRQRAEGEDFEPVMLNASANIQVATELRRFDSHNVVARLEGSDEQLKDEYVIYSAHWDHLGRNPALSGDQIYNGAIDNAAGTAQLLEIAEGFAALDRAPRRSILFIATTAEEVGYLGAIRYITRPLFPLAAAVANINLDAGNVWGRTTDVTNLGYGLTSLDAVLAAAAERQNRTFLEQPFAEGVYFFLSDQFMFATAGIPSAFPSPGETYIGRPADFGGQKWNEYGMKRYHAVSDEVEPDWDLSGAAEDARWLLDAGHVVAQDDAIPFWNEGLEFRRGGVAAAADRVRP